MVALSKVAIFQWLTEDNALLKFMKFLDQEYFDLITSFIQELAEKIYLLLCLGYEEQFFQN